MPKAIRGVFAYSITPTNRNEGIDFGAWKAHADWLIAEGVHGITLFGSTGSNGYFTEAERAEALEVMGAHIGGRVPIQMGIGSMTTGEAARLAKHAEHNGADAVLVIPLNYWRPSEAEILAHYQKIAAATTLPVWIYNNPALAGIDLTPDVVAKIAKSPNVVGMKDSSGQLTRVFMVPRLTGGQVQVGVGQDTLVLEAIAGGSPAWFTGLANIVPKACVTFWNSAAARDVAAAYEASLKLFDLAELGGRYGIVRVAHTGLAMMGKGGGGPRAPMAHLTGAAADELASALKAFGAI